ncbi:MAG: hypothetical protein EB117_17190 [Betaproteobacteria bacterium]|nr:hypothetical protein [Betaproteobacteria bacterium]
MALAIAQAMAKRMEQERMMENVDGFDSGLSYGSADGSCSVPGFSWGDGSADGGGYCFGFSDGYGWGEGTGSGDGQEDGTGKG